MRNLMKPKTVLAVSILIVANFATAGIASAHCDGMDGPVIIEAKAALEKKDVTPLLKWVPEKREHTIKEAFAKTLSDRVRGKTAQEAADRRLFEKLVRVHRESEGAAFTGIKPAGHIAPVVVEADAALDKKDIDHLAQQMAEKVEKSIRDKFQKALHSKEYADQSVEKGRGFVSNYVQYVHFVEEVNDMLSKTTAHHETAEPASGHKH